jgi:excisionase family DNA binding protein
MHGTAEVGGPADGRPPARKAYPVKEVAQLLAGVSERYVWHLIASGELEAVKVGGRRVVRAEALDAYLERLTEDERRVRAAAT